MQGAVMAFRMVVRAIATVLTWTIMIGLSTATADEIKLMAANAVKEAIQGLLPDFERETGHKVSVIWGGTTGLAKRVEGGEIVDLVLIGSDGIDKLLATGRLVLGSRTDWAKSGVGVAVRAGMPKPDISTPEALKAAILSAKSVAYSSGPSGYYIAELLKKLGIAEQVKDRVKQPPSGVQISQLIARGDADLGFQQISELLHAKGIQYLGPLPASIQNMTIYSIGVHTAALAPDAAKTLVKVLSGPGAAPIIKKIGMEPG
jgi:molybdate transport system substrate-binding protein